MTTNTFQVIDMVTREATVYLLAQSGEGPSSLWCKSGYVNKRCGVIHRDSP